jgi:glycolate oxidase iron-sulfur subunit
MAGAGHAARMLMLAGCVQPAMAPNINAATARVLDRLGIALFEEGAGCCGACASTSTTRTAARMDDAAQHRRLVAARRGGRRGDRRHRLGLRRAGAGLRPPAGRRPGYAEKAARVSELLARPAEVVAPRRRPAALLLEVPADGERSPSIRPARCSTA